MYNAGITCKTIYKSPKDRKEPLKRISPPRDPCPIHILSSSARYRRSSRLSPGSRLKRRDNP